MQLFCSRATASSHFSRQDFTSFTRRLSLKYLIKICAAHLTKGSILFIFDPLATFYSSLIYDILFNALSDTLLEFLNGVWMELQPPDRAGAVRKLSFKFLKQNTAALQSRKKTSIHKIPRHETEGFNHLIKTYKSSAQNADLSQEDILDSLSLLPWFSHRFWKMSS